MNNDSGLPVLPKIVERVKVGEVITNFNGWSNILRQADILADVNSGWLGPRYRSFGIWLAAMRHRRTSLRDVKISVGQVLRLDE